MKRVCAVTGLGLALTLALSSSAVAETASLCGPLREYRAPTAATPGSITVGSEQYAIASTAQQSIAPGTTSAGTNVCLRGTWVMSQTVGRNLTEFTLTLQQASSPLPAAAPGRKCDLASPYGVNTGADAPYGYLADQIEVTFCGNRRLNPAELMQFTATYDLTLVQIVGAADQSQNAYYFRIAAGATPPAVVRRVAEHVDVRSVGVVPLGRAAGPVSLPSTSTSGRAWLP